LEEILIKAIDTIYNGYKFRSRLEARWAVFFDSLFIKYEYEKEGYDLNGEWYLPDFWMPDWNCWIEIKPKILKLPLGYTKNGKTYIEPKKELNLCRKLSDNTNNVVLLIGGNPWAINLSDDTGSAPYYSFQYEIVVLFPNSIMHSKSFNKSLQETKFALKFWNEPYYDLLEQKFYTSPKENTLYWFINNEYKNNKNYFKEPCPKRGDVYGLIKADREYFLSKHGYENPIWQYDLAKDRYVFQIKNKNMILVNECTARSIQDEKIIRAYNKAQQIRFEKNKNDT
jgi:hypothetical protein